MPCLFWTGALSLSLSLISLAEAAVYRCPGADGVPSFQAVPCVGQGAAPLQLPPINTLGDGMRPSERQWLLQRARDTRTDRGQPRRSTGSAGKTQRSEAERCLRERQRLDSVQAKLRRGYKPAQGERLRRRRDEHSQYLRQFCD